MPFAEIKELLKSASAHGSAKKKQVIDVFEGASCVIAHTILMSLSRTVAVFFETSKVKLKQLTFLAQD